MALDASILTMEKAGWSRKDLARTFGVTPRYIRKLLFVPHQIREAQAMARCGFDLEEIAKHVGAPFVCIYRSDWRIERD